MIKSYSENAQQLKNELGYIKNKFTLIDTGNKCEECNKNLFN
jgi:hypothetical protein